MTDETADHENASASGAEDRPSGFWAKHGQNIFLAAFAVYFILLLIGVVAEVFKIESVLDWWIWKTPGKP